VLVKALTMSESLDIKAVRLAMESQGLTQAEVVRRSGLSRAQLSRLLSLSVASVRKDTVTRLAQGLDVSPSEILRGGRLHDFRNAIAEEHERIDFRGIGMPQFEPQPIEDVFVDLTLREHADSSDACRPGSGEVPRSRTPQPIAATECVRTQDRVVVLGHPGSGKTTLLRYLTHCCARDTADEGELPIYIRLAEFSRAQELDERVDLLKFAAARAADRGCPDVEESLKKELSEEKRRCLVLLDGLDEVAEHDQNEKLIAAVKAFVSQYPNNRYVVTSRIVGFESGTWADLGFSVFRVLGYSRKQLHAFAEKWAKLLARIQGQLYSEVLEDLQSAIFSNPRVRALASNPLILTILVLLSGARGGTLPRRRVDLYQKVVDVFLDSWEKSKRATDKFDETYSINLDAREFRWLLSDVSLAIQKAERTLAPRWWLAEKMREYLQNKLGFELNDANDTCDRIIRYLAERTGLIEERGRDLFGFSHRTLQEYFASLGAIDEADASPSRDVSHCIRDYLFHPQWCEVVRLIAAQLTPPLAESLLSSIVDDPDPVGRFLRRGPLLALKCLSDGTTVANRRLIANVFENLTDLGRSKWLGITLDAFDVLESLEGTRLERQAKDTIAAILAAAEAELDSDDFECLYNRIKLREVFDKAGDGLFAGSDSEAAREVPVTIDGKEHKVVFFNAAMLLDHPDAWYKSVCAILEDENKSLELKQLIVRELGRRIGTDRRSRMRLRKILVSDAATALRVASAWALASGSNGRHSTKRLLARVLEQDRDEQVRAACAAGLKEAASEDPTVRDRLVQFLEGGEPAGVCGGAARGLSKVAMTDESIADSLLRRVRDESEADETRVSCAWSLQPQIGKERKITNAFKGWLDAQKPPNLRRVAAQCLAVVMADESITWDHRVVEKAEHILMTLTDPCPHALESLTALATARVVRGGLRLETVLRDSLEPLVDRIEVAFVFGSTARKRQTEDSDIDLFIIGNANLKDVSTPLRGAENTLGRRINPVMYTRQSFEEKYHAGDPFLLDVYRREKIPIIPSSADSSGRSLDDELRAMVSERLASTV